jgi:Zn-dependent peptidase ImmA (M78 family)
MTKTLNRMADLYSRLSDIGFPPKYVREVALPDWWCDEFEQSDGAVINAASYAARRFNLNLESLLEHESLPSFNLMGKPKFKTIKDSDCNKFSVATALCNGVAKLISHACLNDYQPLNHLSIQEIRNILLENDGIVSLESVLKLCWQRGIPVLHANNFPKAAKKFQGMVTHTGDRPVIIISFQHESPSRLLFIAGHELGHIYKQHISSEIGSIIDEKIDVHSNEKEEIEANEVAVELLLGKANMNYYFPRQYNGKGLAKHVKDLALRDKVSPGLIAWNYAWNTGNWDYATKAAKLLEPEDNAPRQINQYLQAQIDWDKLSDDNQDHLKLFLKLEGN